MFPVSRPSLLHVWTPALIDGIRMFIEMGLGHKLQSFTPPGGAVYGAVGPMAWVTCTFG